MKCKLKRWGVLLALALYVFVLAFPNIVPVPKILYFNVSASLPLGVYLAIPSFGLRDGDIVSFAPEDWVYEMAHKNGWMKESEGNILFLKHVAMAGHHYETDNISMRFTIDDHYIGPISTDDGKGHAIPVKYGVFEIPEGTFLPLSAAGRSLDGRYMGPVSTDRIVHRIIPLITW